MKLGFKIDSRSFFCWNCGAHRGIDVLVRMLGIPEDQASEAWRSLGSQPGSGLARDRDRDRRVQPRVSTLGYRRPPGTGPLTEAHARYLEGRGFDPGEIAAEWGACSTGPVSTLDGINYRNRLFIPIVWDGREASFQARDTTGRSERKYMACPEPRELAHHKHVLYGRQEAWARGLVIAVEGVTDAWRLGPLAAATFGVRLTREQVGVLSRMANRVAVVFDGERQAQRQARMLVAQLRTQGLEAVAVSPTEGQDPGGMSSDDARCMVREIRRWGRQVQVLLPVQTGSES